MSDQLKPRIKIDNFINMVVFKSLTAGRRHAGMGTCGFLAFGLIVLLIILHYSK